MAREDQDNRKMNSLLLITNEKLELETRRANEAENKAAELIRRFKDVVQGRDTALQDSARANEVSVQLIQLHSMFADMMGRNYGYTKSNSKQPNVRSSVPRRSSTVSLPKNVKRKKTLLGRVLKRASCKKRNSSIMLGRRVGGWVSRRDLVGDGGLGSKKGGSWVLRVGGEEGLGIIS